MDTLQSVYFGVPPEEEKQAVLLSVSCSCGNLRNFKITHVLKSMADNKAVGYGVKTYCEACGTQIEVGLGYSKLDWEKFTKTVPAYLTKQAAVVTQDSGGMVAPVGT